ncbi:putative B3 domain-containing protein Os03g0621600 [Olea europaea var. sylvestris]|uniref:putative B3 domain-containing protein Os03g0621600 n=1 Tax=Olea europaea var. sylvestris TaxID=158386 RepID=UPI000C1CD278|nr:putative B3 domain-containing protein Os03g0621600 [Olea europaea var. sylvestris]
MDVPHNVSYIFYQSLEPELGNTLRLTAYDGITVTVQLERIDGEIYLANGWEEFFDHHNLQDGYVVVFESNGDSMLNMRIFDHSRAEITYSSNYEVNDDDLNMDNSAFEVKLTLDHNNHREISIPGSTMCQDMCKMFESSTLYFTTRKVWLAQSNNNRMDMESNQNGMVNSSNNQNG